MNANRAQWKCDRCGYGEWIHEGDGARAVARAIQHDRHDCPISQSVEPLNNDEVARFTSKYVLMTRELWDSEAELRASAKAR